MPCLHHQAVRANRQARKGAQRYRPGVHPVRVLPVQSEPMLDAIGITGTEQIDRDLDVAVAAGQRHGRRTGAHGQRAAIALDAHRVDHQHRRQVTLDHRRRLDQQQSAFAHGGGQRAGAQPHQAVGEDLLHRQAIGAAQHPHPPPVRVHPHHAARGTGPDHALCIHYQRLGAQQRVALRSVDPAQPVQRASVPAVLFQRILAAEPQAAIGGFGDGSHCTARAFGSDKTATGDIPDLEPIAIGRPQHTVAAAQHLSARRRRTQTQTLRRLRTLAFATR